MKKFLITIVAVFATVSVNAKDWYGSNEGGFALTFNANPVLNFVGNMFNGTQNNSVSAFEGIDSDDLFGGTTITGKYFLQDELALVAGFGFNNKYNVKNNYEDTKDYEKVTSYSRNSTTAFQAMAGLEYRLRAGERLQPLFGAGLVFVHTNDWNYSEITDGTLDGDYVYSGAPANKVGLILNAGVEYFIIEQISLGANLDFAIAKTWRNSAADIDPDTNHSSFSKINKKETFIGTGNFGANVTLNFYF